jgi:hypothetical protein
MRWFILGRMVLPLRGQLIAFGLTLLITVAASAVVWATPLASFVVPEDGIIDSLLSFLIQVVLFTLTFALLEEIGIRGYLLPKLLPLGRTTALALSGLVWATWHMPLILLTPVFPVGNKLLAPVLRHGGGRKFRLRIPEAPHRQRVARFSGACGAQRRLGRPGGFHRNLLSRSGEQVSGRGLRSTDSHRRGYRCRMAQPQAYEGWSRGTTAERHERPGPRRLTVAARRNRLARGCLRPTLRAR